jgi:hypothetical protein
MSDTRHTTRRPPVSSRRALPPASEPPMVLSPRVEALRKLVAAGQYHVSPKWLAIKIFKSAGVPIPSSD